MDDIKIRLLELKEIKGGFLKRPLKSLQIYGPSAAQTDLSALLGGHDGDRYVGNKLEAYYYTQTQAKSGLHVVSIGPEIEYDNFPNNRILAIRPVLEASKETINALLAKNPTLGDLSGVTLCEYGHYPQTYAGNRLSQKLEKLFIDGTLKEIGQSYTFGKATKESEPFEIEKHSVYQYEGATFVKVIPRETQVYHENRLLGDTTGDKKIHLNRPYWVSVEPIQWIVDPSGLLISKKSLIAGIPMLKEGEHPNAPYSGDFQNTIMGKFLQEIFLPEIGQKAKFKEQQRLEQIEKEKQAMEISRRQVTSEKIIKQLPDWLVAHPNPTKEDFLSVPAGQDKNMINLLVDAGIDALRQALPPEKWVGRKKDLMEIFATVDKKDPKTRLTLSCFDARLKARAHKQLVQAKYLKARKTDQH